MFSPNKQNASKNKRVFVLNTRNCSHDELKTAFSECGTVTDVYQIKGKDIAYITYAKVSQALLAIEQFHNKEIETSMGKSNPIKVIMATEKGEKNTGQTEMNRIFIRVEKDISAEDIRSDFEEFGQVDHIHILQDQQKKSKGLAYVTYIKASEAAKAVEKCESHYRAIFADSQERRAEKRQRPESISVESNDRRYQMDMNGDRNYKMNDINAVQNDMNPMQIINQTSQSQCFPSECSTLEVVVKNTVPYDMLSRLLSMVPGFLGFESLEGGMLSVSYQSNKCASFALDKLHGFEYPPGFRIMARFSQSNFFPRRTMNDSFRTKEQDYGYADNEDSKMARVIYCKDLLPQKCQLADPTDAVACRLFVVSNPTPFDENILTDIFCRFGDCIDAYFLQNKNFGYVKYASKESAFNAIDMMHGKKINGRILKVLEAEPPKENPGHKRTRTLSH